METALLKSQLEYRLAVENANEAISVACENKLCYVNHKVTEHTGYSTDELMSMSFTNLVHPDDREVMHEHYQKRLKGDPLPEGYNLRLITKERGIKWVEANAVLISWGDKPATLVFASDITKHKMTEEALSKSKVRFRHFADLLPEAVFELDLDGNFTFANKKALDLFGYSPKDLENGIDTLKLFIPEDRLIVNKNIAKLLSREDVGLSGCTAQYTAQKKVGSTFPAMVHLSRIVAGGNIIGLQGITIDITERNKAEAQFLSCQKKLRSLTSQISQAKEHEMLRISAKPHDCINQNLAVYSTKLEASEDVSLPFSLPKKLNKVQSTNQSRMNERSTFSLLTTREREVLQLVAEGRSIKEIAACLGISAKTVETHRYKIMEKLRIYNTAGLTKYAIREGLASVDL